MSVARQSEHCPFCREPIAVGAVRCKHCHADLADVRRQKKSFWHQFNTFRTGFLAGLLFSLILALLAYLQFYSGE